MKKKSLGERNNNPGNMVWGPYAKSHGAIAKDSGSAFAIFPDIATGRAAHASLLFVDGKFRHLNLTNMIAKYAPPSENDTAAYQRFVLSKVGGVNKKLSDYSPEDQLKIIDAMETHEGFNPGGPIGIAAADALLDPSKISAPNNTIQLADLANPQTNATLTTVTGNQVNTIVASIPSTNVTNINKQTVLERFNSIYLIQSSALPRKT